MKQSPTNILFISLLLLLFIPEQNCLWANGQELEIQQAIAENEADRMEQTAVRGPLLNEPIKTPCPWWKQPIYIGMVLNFFFILVYLFYYLSVRRIRMEERLKSEFEKKLSNVEMSALRAQMSPHFIFNCLNSIDYYILKNETDKASDYLNRFSRLIRLILQNSRSNYVNLKDELEALRLYIEMESLRFHNRFDYSINLDSSIKLADLEVPPMLLQPYVENAIWHGLLHKKEHGLLELNMSLKENHLFCVIKDNGIGRKAAAVFRSKSATKQKSMGTQITEDRISLINRLYDTNAAVEIIDLENNQGQASGTQVELTIPI